MRRSGVGAVLAAGALLAGCAAGAVGAGGSSGAANSRRTSRPGPTAVPAPSPTPRPVRVQRPHGRLTIADITFVGDTIWALATVGCSRLRCTVIERSADGGRTWRRLSAAPTNVVGLRFATPRIGYVFGPTALLMTTDGGRHWRRQPGLGAVALAPVGGNVVLVDAGNTPRILFERSRVGGTSWSKIPIPGGRFPFGDVYLAGAGQTAVVTFDNFNPAKGNGINQAGMMYRSSDAGMTWTKRTDPCPSLGSGHTNVLTAATVASDGAVVAGCGARRISGTTYRVTGGTTITSTDAGGSFATPQPGGKLGPAGFVAAASAEVQLVVTDHLYRSTDRGDTWSRVPYDINGVTFIGFQSAKVARIVAGHGRQIWTTRDGGATWARKLFR